MSGEREERRGTNGGVVVAVVDGDVSAEASGVGGGFAAEVVSALSVRRGWKTLRADVELRERGQRRAMTGEGGRTFWPYVAFVP